MHPSRQGSVLVFSLSTMQFSIRTTSIIAALLISGAMVGTAFWLSGEGVRSVNAISTEDILRAYATKDTDADGLPDWQEALYGLDPSNPRSADPNMTDAQAVTEGRVTPNFSTDTSAAAAPNVPGIDAAPETLTDRFGRKFLENYMRLNQTGALSEADMSAFIQEASAELDAERLPRFELSDVILSARGKEALLSYVAQMDETLAAYSAAPDEKTVYDYFSDFVTDLETVESMARINELARAYHASSEAIMGLSVPPEMAGRHLDFANAYSALGDVTDDMAAMGSDPLRGLLGLLAYADTWGAYSDALAALGKSLSEQLDQQP